MTDRNSIRADASADAPPVLSAYKVVLPNDVLKDLEGTEAERCLDKHSMDGFFYIADFVNEAEEAHMMSKIQSAPQPKWRTLQARSGQTMCRLQNWGGQVSKQILIPEPLPDFLTSFPDAIERIRKTGVFASSKHGEPNHCLMNEYKPGQGIMPHEDGGAYFPVVATISLGSHTLLDVYRYANNQSELESKVQDGNTATAREAHPRFSILQERRSLLITSGAAYRHFLHGIAERAADDSNQLANVTNGDMTTDAEIGSCIKEAKEGKEVKSLQRSLRYSLTLRDVERVASQSLVSMLTKR